MSINVLVACEESQAVTKELRRLGHNAYSCDLLRCSGGRPEWHFKMNVFDVIENHGGVLENGELMTLGKWDLMIAHPPCTFLAVSGSRWFYHPHDKHLPITQRREHPRFPGRSSERESALKFFLGLAKAPIKHIAIENPVSIVSTRWRKPDQIVQPWMFGDKASKKTCLWLKNLPSLESTEIVDAGPRIEFASGKSQAKWYSDALVNAKTAEERRTLRSKTFPGLAKAMAMQWSQAIVNTRDR